MARQKETYETKILRVIARDWAEGLTGKIISHDKLGYRYGSPAEQSCCQTIHELYIAGQIVGIHTTYGDMVFFPVQP